MTAWQGPEWQGWRFGLRKTTLLDFPGEVAATLFLPGCNLRCPFCHNPELVLPGCDRSGLTGWDEVRTFIRARRGLLGGICLSGGEPLLSPHLESIVDFIHEQGFKVKLDTNGTLPGRLKRLRVEYIAMDIKTLPERYGDLGGERVEPEKLRESIDWIMGGEAEYEFRTTVVPGLVDTGVIAGIARLIPGARRYVLAQYRPKHTLDPAYREIVPYPTAVLEEMLVLLREAGIRASLRAGYGR